MKNILLLSLFGFLGMNHADAATNKVLEVTTPIIKAVQPGLPKVNLHAGAGLARNYYIVHCSGGTNVSVGMDGPMSSQAGGNICGSHTWGQTYTSSCAAHWSGNEWACD